MQGGGGRAQRVRAAKQPQAAAVRRRGVAVPWRRRAARRMHLPSAGLGFALGFHAETCQPGTGSCHALQRRGWAEAANMGGGKEAQRQRVDRVPPGEASCKIPVSVILSEYVLGADGQGAPLPRRQQPGPARTGRPARSCSARRAHTRRCLNRRAGHQRPAQGQPTQA